MSIQEDAPSVPSHNQSGSYEFPKVTKELKIEEVLQITKKYLISIQSASGELANGPFGLTSWIINQPSNLGTSYFGRSLLHCLFGSEDAVAKEVRVTPFFSGYIPMIEITTESGESASIRLENDGKLTYVVLDGGNPNDGTQEVLDHGELGIE